MNNWLSISCIWNLNSKINHKTNLSLTKEDWLLPLINILQIYRFLNKSLPKIWMKLRNQLPLQKKDIKIKRFSQGTFLNTMREWLFLILIPNYYRHPQKRWLHIKRWWYKKMKKAERKLISRMMMKIRIIRLRASRDCTQRVISFHWEVQYKNES